MVRVERSAPLSRHRLQVELGGLAYYIACNYKLWYQLYNVYFDVLVLLYHNTISYTASYSVLESLP